MLTNMMSASAWLFRSLCIDRMRQISFAMLGVWVGSSFDSLPGWKVSTLSIVPALVFGLGIEEVHLAGAAAMDQLDDGLSAEWGIRWPIEEAVRTFICCRRLWCSVRAMGGHRRSRDVNRRALWEGR